MSKSGEFKRIAQQRILRRDSGHITGIGWAIYSLEEEFDASGQSLLAS
jgi:hypothetical protein